MKVKTRNHLVIVAFSTIIFVSVRYMVQTYEWNRYGSVVGQLKFETRSRAKRVGLAIEAYAADNDNRVPITTNESAWQSLLQVYGAKTFQSRNPEGGSFRPNPRVAGYKLKFLQENHIVVAFEEKPWKQGERALLFADGKVKFQKGATSNEMGGLTR